MVIHKNLVPWAPSNSSQQLQNYYENNQQPIIPAYVPQPSYPTYHVLQAPSAYFAPQQPPQIVEWASRKN